MENEVVDEVTKYINAQMKLAAQGKYNKSCFITIRHISTMFGSSYKIEHNCYTPEEKDK